MKERPILFNAEMVRAILDGRKTQTRRAVKGVPSEHDFHGWILSSSPASNEGKACWAVGKSPLLNNPIRVRCPFGEVGDRLWVREAFGAQVRRDACGGTGEFTVYRASKPDAVKYTTACGKSVPVKWTPSIHMPRWASRITLEITGVRVERLASISDEDAGKEGYPADPQPYGGRHDKWLWFRQLWDSIYPEHSFKANPWVWVVEFKRVDDEVQ